MKLVYDILILTGLVMTALPAVILLYHRQKNSGSWENRHPKITLATTICLLLGTSILLYGSFIEPRLLVVKYETIDLPNIHEPITVAFFADMQVGPLKKTKHVEKIVKKIIALNPDLVFLGGDQINNSVSGEDETIYLEPLKELAEKIPTYAVHGNHEYGVSYNGQINGIKSYLPDLSAWTKQKTEQLGVNYLVNELVTVEVREEKFYLFGGDSWWANKLDLSELNHRDNPEMDTVVLIHNPAAAWEIQKHDVELFLAGHTHGGQIRLPFIGPLAMVDNVIPRHWYKGWFELDSMKGLVTSGTGETGTRARLFNLPEIVILTIK